MRRANRSIRTTLRGAIGGLVASWLLFTCAGMASAQPAIDWRLENPFRLFSDPAETEVHRATFAALSPQERSGPVLAAERALSSRLEDGWAASASGKTCWSQDHNRYQCPTPEAYIRPTSHAVLVELHGWQGDPASECTWLTAPRGGSRSRGIALTAPCGDRVKLEVPYPFGIDLVVEADGARLAQTRIEVRDILVVGIGDSFASGEGNPDVPIRFSRERATDYGGGSSDVALVGYPARVGAWRQIGDPEFVRENARWLDQACHRSLYSHQLRAALQLAVEDPRRAVTFVGVACSGAEITAGLFLRYKGNEWVANPPELSQISAVAAAQCGGRSATAIDLPEAYHMGGSIPELQGGLVLHKCDVEHARRIDLLLVSIGGNDIGFARLVANAVLSDDTALRQLGGWFGQVHGLAAARAQIMAVAQRYKALNRAIHNLLHIPWAEADRVIVTAYPGLAVMEDGRTVCPDGPAGMDVLGQFKLDAGKAREGSIAAERLNEVMRSAAREHGWTYVERHRREFLGRGICAGFAEASFTTADDLRLPRRIDGRWSPYNPADYRPYARRQRWFRTPNDAFMTGNFHVSQSILNNVLKTKTLAWVQVMLAATYSGAFHPTAEGQAAIADAVVEKARAVLAKYGPPRTDAGTRPAD